MMVGPLVSFLNLILKSPSIPPFPKGDDDRFSPLAKGGVRGDFPKIMAQLELYIRLS
jgi:hypothetical protein